jgi:hypothetical protein
MGRLLCLRAGLPGEPPLSPFKGEAQLRQWDEDYHLQRYRLSVKIIQQADAEGDFLAM